MKLWIVVLSEYNVRIVMSTDGPVTIFPIYLTGFLPYNVTLSLTV